MTSMPNNITERIVEALKKQFFRTDLSPEKLGYMSGWFIRDDITGKELMDFLISACHRHTQETIDSLLEEIGSNEEPAETPHHSPYLSGQNTERTRNKYDRFIRDGRDMEFTDLQLNFLWSYFRDSLTTTEERTCGGCGKKPAELCSNCSSYFDKPKEPVLTNDLSNENRTVDTQECKRCGLLKSTCESPDGDEWAKNCQRVEGNKHDFGNSTPQTTWEEEDTIFYCPDSLFPHRHSNSQKREWEEEFEEKYCNFEISERISKPDMLAIKDFIRSLLSHQHSELREMVEGMKKAEGGKQITPSSIEINWASPMYNQALDDLLSKLDTRK